MREDYQEQPNKGRPTQYPSEADMIREQLEHDLNESEAARTGGNDPEAPVDTSLHSKPEPLHAAIGDAIDPKTLGVLARFRKPIERPKAAEPEPSNMSGISETRPSQNPIEQQSKFDAAELETLKAGDAVVGTNGGRAFIAERREDHGKILFDVFFRGNPEMKTFALDDFKKAGAGIQSIERSGEKSHKHAAGRRETRENETYAGYTVWEKSGGRIELQEWVADQKNPKGGYYKAHRVSSKGFATDYLLVPSMLRQMLADRQQFQLRKGIEPATGSEPEKSKSATPKTKDISNDIIVGNIADLIEDDEARQASYRTMAERDGVRSPNERNLGKKKRDQKASM